MRLEVGTRVGRYEIAEQIGAGGMGEVYRAVDTRLAKMVALKVVASSVLEDPACDLRFQRERQLTAALDHPHVCRLLDAGHEAGVTYLVMEYLDGEPLSRRLARGRIPPRQALEYAIELADALSYAHARGVIHRDLKPGNVHLTSTGLKVLDFGLAKLRPASAVTTPQSDTAPLLKTTPGMLIGTALYMAPERLAGGDADERTDIFGFGLVVYEMLAGRPAFHGDSMAGLIADVMTSDPPPLPVCADGYEELEWVLRRCLAKPPQERWQSMQDVAAVLRRLATSLPTKAPPNEASRRGWFAAAAILAIVLLSGAVAWFRVTATRTSATPVVFRVEPPSGGGFTPTANSVQSPMLAVSPDGTAVAYVAAGGDGVSQIWIRTFASLTARPLRGTEDAVFPFWSPSGRSIGFFSRGELKRIDVAGGPPRRLADAPAAVGGAWSSSDVIVFSPSVKGGLRRVSAHGGAVTDATRLDATGGQISHRWPRFIGDGSRYVFFARSTLQAAEGIYVASLASDAPPQLLATSEFGGDVVPPDRLLYVSEGSLVARPFDAAEGRVTGEPTLVAEGVAGSSNFYAAFSVSRTGVLAYASVAQASDLTWFDRTGKALSVVARGSFVDFRLSPDNQYLAVAQTDARTGRPDIHLLDLMRRTTDRLTSSRLSDGSPTWSPDGRNLLFRSNREAVHDLYLRAAFGTDVERPFLKTGAAKYPTSWSGPESTILFHSLAAETGWDIWVVRPDAPDSPIPAIRTPFNESQGQLSPDGRWIAYAADESSAFEVYAQRFTPGGRRWSISVGGGSDPRWNPNGSELFYLSADGWLMSVAVSPNAELHPAAPQRLFRLGPVAIQPPYTSVYDVSADAKHFLVRVPREDLRTLPLTVVVNRPL